MKLVSFTTGQNKEERTGALIGGNVLDLAKAAPGALPSDMLLLIEGGEELWRQAQAVVRNPPPGALLGLSQVKLCAPLTRPSSLRDFIAYEEHAKAGALRRGEPLAAPWYELPAYYKGNHREILGPDEEIPWPVYTRKLDFECEVACVIGKKGVNLTPEEAGEYIFGYMIFNDVSARDIQAREMALRLGPNKGKDFANVFGPYLATKDEADPGRDFAMKVRVNGEVWSEGHFKDHYWGFALMVSHVSQAETIYPGDILGCGTYYKGCGLDLDRWVKPGDIIELEVNKLGVLRNRVGHPREFRELNYKNAVSLRAQRSNLSGGYDYEIATDPPGPRNDEAG